LTPLGIFTFMLNISEITTWAQANTEAFGFIVAASIFLLTVLLAVCRLIGFLVTLLFLLFSIASGFLIVNHDIIRGYLEDNFAKPSTSLQTFNFEITDDDLIEDI